MRRMKMALDRRDFLTVGLSASLVGVLPRSGSAQHPFTPRPDSWRNFETTTRVELVNAQGASQAWIPVPALNEPAWIRPMGNTWQTNARTAVLQRDPKYGAEMLHLEWSPGETPTVEVTSRFATRDRAVDITTLGGAVPISA